VAGAWVQVTALTWAPEFEVLGVDRTLAIITAEATDGTLTLYRTDPEQSDAQTVWWLRHRPAHGPGHGCGEQDTGLLLSRP
jgi:hypothetical protein